MITNVKQPCLSTAQIVNVRLLGPDDQHELADVVQFDHENNGRQGADSDLDGREDYSRTYDYTPQLWRAKSPWLKPSSRIYVPIQPFDTFHMPKASQKTSILLSLPTEILQQIYVYVFSDQENTEKLYDFDAVYRQPDNLAPRIIYTALLSCCQKTFCDARFLPYSLSRQTLWICNEHESPVQKITEGDLLTLSTAVAREQPALSFQELRLFIDVP